MKRILFSTLFALASVVLFLNFSVQGPGYGIGDKVEDFSLKNIDGKMLSLKDLEGAKGYIVVFTCNHCPFAVANEDRIIELDKKYKPKGFPVVAIQPNDTEMYPTDDFEHMQERAKEKGFTFPYLIDENQAVAKAFGASKTPHFYLVDGDMTVRYIGALDDNARDAKGVNQTYLADAVDALLAGKEIKMKETKAVGCGIKYRQ